MAFTSKLPCYVVMNPAISKLRVARRQHAWDREEVSPGPGHKESVHVDVEGNARKTKRISFRVGRAVHYTLRIFTSQNWTFKTIAFIL